MLNPKNCPSGLQKRVGVFGFEVLDLLLAVPFFYVPGMFLDRPLMGAALAAGVATALRLVKLGRLPGVTTDLFLYLLLSEHNGVLGRDRAPLYPHTQISQSMSAFYRTE